MVIIILCLCALAVYLIQNYLYRNYWDKDLDVDIRFQDEPVYEGEEATLTQTVTNAKKLPLLVLHVKYEIDRKLQYKNLENTNVSDKSYKHDIYTMLPYQQISRTMSILCTGRGYYRITTMDINSTDIFMSSSYFERFSYDTSLYVFPKRMRVDEIEIPFRALMGNIITKRVTNEDPFEFRGIRDYQPFDSIKKINWKASARADKMLVNLYDYTAGQEIRILLNLEDETTRKQTELLEMSIRLAAALSERFINAGVPVSLVTNGLDCLSGKPSSVETGSNRRHMLTINKTLARIDLDQTAAPFLSMMNEEIISATARHETITYVLISYVQRQDIFDAFNDLCKGLHSGSLWLVPLLSYMEQRVLSSPNSFDVYRWEVGKDEYK